VALNGEGIVVAGGRALEDVTRGVPAARYLSASFRFGGSRGTASAATLVHRVRPEEDGGRIDVRAGDDSLRVVTVRLRGASTVELMSRHYNGKSLVEASPEDRIAILTMLSDHEQMTDLPEVRFYIELKRLTVRGYYTSKIGIHDELEYKGNRINQEFVGCDDQGPATS